MPVLMRSQNTQEEQMATPEQIEAAVDQLANAAEETWARNGDMLATAAEDLDIEMPEVIEKVAIELMARFGA